MEKKLDKEKILNEVPSIKFSFLRVKLTNYLKLVSFEVFVCTLIFSV